MREGGRNITSKAFPLLRILAVVVLIAVVVYTLGPTVAAGDQSASTLSVHITSPGDGALLFQSPVPVEGIIAGPVSRIASVTCTNNGSEYPATGSGVPLTFKVNVTLEHGVNLIEVSVTDREGNSSSSSIEVVFEDLDLLIQTYGPVVWFWDDRFGWGDSGDELYFPDDVEAVLDSSSLACGIFDIKPLNSWEETEFFDWYLGTYGRHLCADYPTWCGGDRWPFCLEHPECWSDILGDPLSLFTLVPCRTCAIPNELGSVATSSQDLMNDVTNLITVDIISQHPGFTYYLKIPDSAIKGDLDRAKAYVRVLPAGSSYTDVQLHIYYPFNGPGRVYINVALGDKYIQMQQAGSHYSDWEVAILRFSNNPVELAWVGLSGHGGIKWYPKDQLQCYEGTHPMIYSAKYSHAFYPFSAFINYELVGSLAGVYYAWLYDLTSGDPDNVHNLDPDYEYRWEVFQEGNYEVVSSAVPGHDVAEPGWLDFQEDWGQPRVNHDDITYAGIDVYEYDEVNWGPYGPKMWDLWFPPTIMITPDPAYADDDLTAVPSRWFNYSGYSGHSPEDYGAQWQKWDGNSWQDIAGETALTLDSSNFVKTDLIRFIWYPYHSPFEEPNIAEDIQLGAVMDTITISSKPPVAEANGPYSGIEGVLIVLSASGSYDMDTDGEISLYEWDLDNDGEYDDAVGEATRASFWDDGTYAVGLRVTDDDGSTDEDQATVYVGNVAPVVELGPDASVREDDNLNITGEVIDVGNDQWVITVDYGDGSDTQQVAPRSKRFFDLEHIYHDVGTYVISVVVEDDDGGVGEDMVTVTVVANESPTANDDAYTTTEDGPRSWPSPGILGNDTDPELDNLVVIDVDSSGAIGAVKCDQSGSFEYDPRGSFDYLDEGETATDQFRYSVSDGRDGSDIATVTITVTGLNDPPVAQVTWDYYDEAKVLIALDGSSSYDPDQGDSIVSWEWDLDGDGEFDDDIGETATIPLPASGILRACLCVTDEHGGIAMATLSDVLGEVASVEPESQPESGTEITEETKDGEVDTWVWWAIGIIIPILGGATALWYIRRHSLGQDHL